MDKPLLTEREVADLLKMKVTTLQAWRTRGQGPNFIKVGGAVRYRPDDLETWLDAQSRTSTSE